MKYDKGQLIEFNRQSFQISWDSYLGSAYLCQQNGVICMDDDDFNLSMDHLEVSENISLYLFLSFLK